MFELAGDEIGEDGGDRLPAEVSGDELGAEERVALTTSENLIDEACRWQLSDQRLDLGGDLVAVEASEVHAARCGQAFNLSETATLLRVGSHLVGAVGTDQHH